MTFSDYLERIRTIHAKRGRPWSVFEGTDHATLAEAETTLGCPVDRDLGAAWRLANGSAAGVRVFMRPGFLTGYDFLSVAAALKERGLMRKRAPTYGTDVEEEPRDGRIRGGWFHEGWLPFAGFGAGTLLLILDHAPAPAGRSGQIIAYTHDPDEIGYVAPSFADLLQGSLAWIERETEDFLELY